MIGPALPQGQLTPNSHKVWDSFPKYLSWIGEGSALLLSHPQDKVSHNARMKDEANFI